mgnify:CR=1 FL=1
MISLFQILVISFALFALSRAILRFKDRQLSFKWLLIWSVLWIGVIIAAIFPPVIAVFAVFFGTRTADLVIFIGLIFNFYLLFKFYIQLERMQQDITRLVRELALRSAKDEMPKM